MLEKSQVATLALLTLSFMVGEVAHFLPTVTRSYLVSLVSELISNHIFRSLDNNCELAQSRHLVKISDMVNPVVTWLSVISLALLNPIYIFNLAT